MSGEFKIVFEEDFDFEVEESELTGRGLPMSKVVEKDRVLEVLGEEIDLSPIYEMFVDAAEGENDFWAIIAGHLGVEVREIYSVKSRHPQYKKGQILVAASNIAEEYGEETERFSSDKFDIYPITHERVEIKPEKYEEFPSDGMTLVSGDKPFAIYVEEFSWGVIAVNVFARNHEFAKEIVSDLEERINNLSFLKGEIIDVAGSFIHLDREYTWDDIILEEEMILDIKKNVLSLFEKSKYYERFGLTKKRGIIFYGPPGTGKTQCVRVLGCELRKHDVTTIVVSASDVMASDGSGIKVVYELASDYSPAMVVLEDFDMYAKDRNVEFRQDILGDLLDEIDGVEVNPDVITLVTTNRLEAIEEALKDRPGRFDRQFEFSPPEGDLVTRMYLHFGSSLLTLEEANGLARKTPKAFTGAHIREVINTALINAIENESFDENDEVVVTRDHFMTAIEIIKRSDAEDDTVGFRI